MGNMTHKILLWGGLLLLAAALCLMLGNLRENAGATLSARQAMSQLEQRIPEPQTPLDPVRPAAAPSGAEAAPDSAVSAAGMTEQEPPLSTRCSDMEMPTEEIDGSTYVGILEIQALDLKLPVLSEWDDIQSKTAPCRYLGSAYENNLIIAGHNYTGHFGSLHRLEADDTVRFTDVAGNCFSFAVTQLEELPATATEEMQAGDWDLTLFTCTVGGAARVTVRCRLTEPLSEPYPDLPQGGAQRFQSPAAVAG